MVERNTYQYCYPVLQCPAAEHFSDSIATSGIIVVPYRALPVPRNNMLWRPPEFKPDWEEWFGCSECGTVRSYTAGDVRWHTIEKSDLRDYAAPGNFYSVQEECITESCQRKIAFLVDMKSNSAEDLQQKLRRGFFYGMWQCGHRLLPFKATDKTVRRIASLPVRPTQKEPERMESKLFSRMLPQQLLTR